MTAPKSKRSLPTAFMTVILIGVVGAGIAYLRQQVFERPSLPELTQVPVPLVDLPPYTLLATAEVTEVEMDKALLSDHIVGDVALLEGQLLRLPAAAGTPIARDQLVSIANPALLTDFVVISVTVRPAVVFDGALQPGMQVSARAGDDLAIDNALIVDVRPIRDQLNYILILAVPEDQAMAISNAAALGRLSLVVPLS